MRLLLFELLRFLVFEQANCLQMSIELVGLDQRQVDFRLWLDVLVLLLDLVKSVRFKPDELELH